MFQRILNATDGSDHAAKAVAIAGELSAMDVANLIIVHVKTEDQPLEALRRFAEAEQIPTKSAPKRVQNIEATPQGPVPIPGGEQTEVDLSAAREAIGKRVLSEAETLAL